MIDKRTIFEIHRLKNLGWSGRKIAANLRIDRGTVKKYLRHPDTVIKQRPRASKLDPFRGLVKELLDQDKTVSAPVVLQHLAEAGFDGGITIVRDYLYGLRGGRKRRAYTRFESAPGKQMQVDWGHFGSLEYGDTRRKLYALVVLEAFSRMLYVRFTHSQKQAALHSGLLDAFTWFGGCPAELLVDNMATAVVERLGSVVRFNDAFLDFLRPFSIVPVACNPASPWEKGKVESSVKFIRHNFWPLRSFTDLDDVQRKVEHWLKTIANVRVHQGTGQRPVDRFEKVTLNPLPDLLPDCRETLSLLVHKDFAVRFDGNTYSAPPWAIGKTVIVKADQKSVSLYLKDKRIAVHPRCWQRKQRIETPCHKQQVKKLRKRLWQDRQVAAFMSLGPVAVDYLKGITDAGLPVKRQVKRLLCLKDRYGAEAVIYALTKSMAHKAWGADYVENIVHQHMAPKNDHPPVKLKNERLNRIRLHQPDLAGYDAHILKRLKCLKTSVKKPRR
jgi:transposase